MRPRLAVIFAVPEESRPFLRRLEGRSALPGGVRGTLHGCEIMVVHSGIGPAAARAAAERVLAAGAPMLALSAGFAAGLQPEICVGEVVLDWRGQREEALPGARLGGIVSVAGVLETPAAKAQLGKQSGALAADMETGAMAEVFATAGTALAAVRVVSDSVDEELPLPFPVSWDLARQRPRPLAILQYLARHPARAAAFLRFIRNLRGGAEALASALAEVAREAGARRAL